MRGGAVPAASFCLASGAALGCLFLLCKALRLLLGMKKWSVAVLDVVFCCFCATAVFLCALAVDRGRLRLFQLCFQALGAWTAVVALDAPVSWLVARVRKIFCKLSAAFHRFGGILRAHFPKKPVSKAKKPQKRNKKAKKAKKKA